MAFADARSAALPNRAAWWSSLRLNQFPQGLCSGQGTVLKGHDDWSNLLYEFRTTTDYADCVHQSAPEEINLADLLSERHRELQVQADSAAPNVGRPHGRPADRSARQLPHCILRCFLIINRN